MSTHEEQQMEEVEKESTVTPAVENTASAVTVKDDEDTTEPVSVSSGSLPWEQDLQMVSMFLDKKEELKGSYQQYMKNNPELRAMLADFMQAVLIQKPDNVYEFAREFFTPFAKDCTPQPCYPSHHFS